jgi:hypothetical protein
VEVGEGVLWLGRAAVLPRSPLPRPPGPTEALQPALTVGGPYDLWFTDADGALFRTVPGEVGVACVRKAEGVSALLAEPGETLSWVERSAGGALTLIVRSGLHVERVPLRGGTGRAFSRAVAGRRLLATEDEEGGLWSVRAAPLGSADPGLARWLRPPPGARVVGVTALEGRPGHARGDHQVQITPALLLLEADGRTFSLLGPHAIEPVHRAVGEVASATVSPAERVVAYLTTAGDLAACALDRRGLLLHLVGAGAR